MKILEKLNDKKAPLYLGAIGFLIFFILFGIDILTVNTYSPVNPSIVIETHKYSSYYLFFANSENPYYSVFSGIFFAFFMVNFVLYLALLLLTARKKDNKKTLLLGILGILINFADFILFLAFMFTVYIDFSDFFLFMIFCEFLGVYVVYASWIYACAKSDKENSGTQTNANGKAYLILSVVEIGLFILPVFIVLAILFLLFGARGANGLGRSVGSKNSKPTQFKSNNQNNTITVGNMKYYVKDNKVFDINTNIEVGHLENDKVIFHIKEN